jgi:restriction system protein
VTRSSSGFFDPERARVERVQRQIERELDAESRRARAEADRAARQHERQAREAEKAARTAAAERRTTELARQVEDLETILRQSVSSPVLTFADLVRVRSRAFDPGDDGEPFHEPTRPVMQEGNWFGRRARRQWFDQQMELFEKARDRHQTLESARRERVAAAEAVHTRAETERRSAARRRAAELSSGVRDGEPHAVEEFARLAIDALPKPRSITLSPSVVYRPDPRELVVDLRLPDDDVVPMEKSVKYVHARAAETVKERPRSEREAIYRTVLAQLPLAAADTVFRAFDSMTVGSVSINGRLTFVDPATGRQKDDFLVSLTTSREEFADLALDAEQLDPVLCIRKLGARLSPHPLAREAVPAFLTFDEAKYKLGSSVDVAGALDGRANLATMPWPDFEQLVRQLLLAMSDSDTRVTRGSRDDGIDGVIFDCDASLGGEYIVQAKRYKNVVPASDVRALAGTMHDKRANHALFVTTAWFSPDGRRFAKNNRVRLIEGPELRKLLLDHLQLDVLIPPQRGRPARGSGPA